MTAPQPCGTYGASQRHRRRGEPMCEPCRAAYNAYMKQFRGRSTDWRIREAARKRALWQLADLHREEFGQLYAAEAARAMGQPRLDAEIVGGAA